ncbi:oligosaccharide flippase family protein [Enterobacteriaceae bacterium RIT697]|uniref:oligosaccharide flippase family protein n=1 Tax=Pantoea sp. YR343 TaxID=1144341 RepID=UPI0002713B2F|nr:oligosaccharide flippase family protein [Pantoea sp. YR343]KAJ9429911.1 oligosaccharide flippase family protein [Pantoea sp. YR343]MRT25515.1 oligosaccharide flippase family protein [Enterobacteriaceae bacterium RIT697]
MYSNSIWIMLEKSVNIIGLIYINALMAKYIGPEDFGKINISTSLFIFVQTLSWFGGQNILFKRMSENTKSGIALAMHTQNQRRIFFLLSSSSVLIYLYFFTDIIVFLFGVANGIATYYIVMDFFSIYNNTQLKSKINTITNVIGLSVALVIRFYISHFKLPVYYFTLPIILIPLIPYILRLLYFKYTTKINENRKGAGMYNRHMLFTGGALILSSLSADIYTQISSIFLAKILSYSNLGVYSVALTIGGAWSFIVLALITSFFSKIYSEKDQVTVEMLLIKINRIVILFSLIALGGFYIFGNYFIHLLYGDKYMDSVNIIPIIIIGTMFSALGTICYRYMIKESGYSYLAKKMFLCCVLTIPLSWLMINSYGINGAAYCFLIVEILSCTLLNYFFRNKTIIKMHLNIFKLR